MVDLFDFSQFKYSFKNHGEFQMTQKLILGKLGNEIVTHYLHSTI